MHVCMYVNVFMYDVCNLCMHVCMYACMYICMYVYASVPIPFFILIIFSITHL